MAGRAGEIRGRCSLHPNPKFAEEKLLSPRPRPPGKRAGGRAPSPSPSPSLPPQIPASYRKLWPNMAATRSGELVRDMSNVPCYLQRAEKRETVQERALNFGVLDWRRLERWKDDRSRPPARSSSSCDSSAFPAIRSLTCSGLPSLDSRLDFSVAAEETCSRGSNGEEFAERKITTSFADDSPIRIPRSRKNSDNSRSGDFHGSRRFSYSSTGDFQFGRLSPSFPRSCPNLRNEEKRYQPASDLSRCSSSRGRTREFDSSSRSKRSSSPLRKLLDPFLKSARSSVPASPGRKISVSASVNQQAFLRVSWKDGVPLFTFSVNEREILAATKKNKNGASGEEIYTFYSVLEMRKKISGSWMKQGSKKELVSEIIGRMNVSAIESAREFVLLGPDLFPCSELAAVVRRDGETAAILPRGIHGLSATGRPATLLERWRSGGRCDCGGWDAGCPLTVLRAGDRSDDDGIDLLSQGGVFIRMGRFREGVYRIEFHSSVAAFQAFGVCVSLLHGTKRRGLHELLSSRQCSPAPPFASRGAAAPPPYFPPLSPVGRA